MDKKGKTPIVSMKLFYNRQYSSGILTTFILSLGQAGIIFSVPVFLQSVRGYTPLQTGLALLPLSLTLLVVSPLSAALSSKIRAKTLVQLGLLVNVLAMIVLRFSLSPETTSTTLIPGLVLFGLGMGLVMSQISNLTLSAVSVSEAGEASGVNNTIRQVGTSFGSAIIGAVLLTSLSTNLISGINQSSVIPREYKSTIASQITKETSQVEFGNGAQFEQNISPEIKNEIMTISHQATSDANRQAFLLGVIFAILGFLISFTLPNVKNIERGISVATKH